MMITDKSACAKKINYLFKRLQKHYFRTNKTLHEMNHLIVSSNEVEAWTSGEFCKSPVLRLNSYFYNWNNGSLDFVNRGFEQEIEYNLLTNNEGYFEYINNTFANQWHFVKQFRESMSLYVNDNTKAISIYNKLYDPPEKFNKSEFGTAIQLELIGLFARAESLYLKYDKAYKRYFKAKDFLRKQKTNPDHIHLDYGEGEEEALKCLFDNLLGFELINCTFNEFALHFDPFANPEPKPINWLGTDMQLMTLFIGRNLPDDDNVLRYYMLRLKKKLDFKTILKHFRLNDMTTDRTLSANYYNSLQRENIRRPKPIRYIIDHLKSIERQTC
jgi:hypothetical protein